jgi:hypothetical protein
MKIRTNNIGAHILERLEIQYNEKGEPVHIRQYDVRSNENFLYLVGLSNFGRSTINSSRK